MKNMKKLLIILFVVISIITQAQVNKQILQVTDTSKYFGTNKQAGDFIDVKTYPTYIFKLNHSVTAMKTVGYALRNGWCDTVGYFSGSSGINTYSAGFGLGLNGTTFYNSRPWSTQDTLKTTLSGIAKLVNGVITTITDNSAIWNLQLDTISATGINDVGNVIIQRGKKQYSFREATNSNSARGTALLNAFNSSLAGDCIIIGSGNYTISSTLSLKASQTIILQGANITSSTNTISIFTVNGINNWEITGNGILTGAGAASGGVYTDEKGIYITGNCQNWNISGLNITNFKGCAIFSNAQSGSYPYDKGGIISNCNIYTNNFGIYFDSPSAAYAAHYNIISNNHIYSNNSFAVYIMGGNCIVSKNIITMNQTGGIYIGNGYNSAHGIISDNEINHNKVIGVKILATPYGMTVANNHIIANDANVELDGCKGVNIYGGMIYAPIVTSDIILTGTLLGKNYISKVNSSNYYLTISGTSTQKDSVYITDCFNSYTNNPTINDTLTSVKSQEVITNKLILKKVQTGTISNISPDKMLLQDTITGIVKRVTTPPVLWIQVGDMIKAADPNARISIGTPDTTLTSLYVDGDYYIKGGNGDVNGNGAYSAVDALYAKLAISGTLTPAQYARADVFATGRITPFEPWFIQQMVLHPPSLTTINLNRSKVKGILGNAAYIMPITTNFTYSGDTITNLSSLGYGYGLMSYATGVPVAAMQITNTGNVGINNGNPTTKLDVIGTIKTGTIAKLSLDTVSAIRLTGNTTVWKDIEGAFSTGLSGGSSYPTYVVDSGYYTFTVDTTAPTICKQYFPAIQINHEFKLGATLYPHVHYKHTTTNGTPTFIVKYRWKNIGSAPSAWNWCKMNNTTGTTDGTLQLNYSTIGIPATGNGVSAILQAQVYLYSQTGTGGVNAYSFDLHGEVDSMGSNSEVDKD